jgi:F-box protein 9
MQTPKANTPSCLEGERERERGGEDDEKEALKMDQESRLEEFRQKWLLEVGGRGVDADARRSTTARGSDRDTGSSYGEGLVSPSSLSRSLHHSSAPLRPPTSLLHPPHPPPPTLPSSSSTTMATAEEEKPDTALQLYEQAVEKESIGNLGESVKLYRRAFRIDENVGERYRVKLYPRAMAVQGEGIAKRHEGGGGGRHLGYLFAGLRIEATVGIPGLARAEAGDEDEEEVRDFSLLAAVPCEILLHILRYVAIADVSGFIRLSQVCRKLCHLVVAEESIWREVCKKIFAKQAWDWKVSVSGNVLQAGDVGVGDSENEDVGLGLGLFADEVVWQRPVDEELLPQYKNSWREMFSMRPRVRFHGVYISTCNYHRPGSHSGNSISWGTPVHIVTYYRYLRFYPDGTVLSLLTHQEPSEVVYGFCKPSPTPAPGVGAPTPPLSWAKNISYGRWRIHPSGRIDVETCPPGMPQYIFCKRLRVQNIRGSGGRAVRGSAKLAWAGFWSWNKLTDDLAEFEGRNDKPFIFSRVVGV